MRAHPRSPLRSRGRVYKSVGAHMEFAARREPPGEGTDLLEVDCITLKYQMALPISYIYTLCILFLYCLMYIIPVLHDVYYSCFPHCTLFP